MDALKKYLDQIHAEEVLKEKTRAFVKDSLENEMQQRTNKSSARGGFAMKKLWVAASTIAACAVLAIGGYAYAHTPVNFVSLDINPSVEVGINAFDTVVTVEGINQDGKNLLKGQKIDGLPLKVAITRLVEEALEQAYIAEDGSTVIAVTVESDDEEKSAELQDEGEQGVSLAMSNKHAIAIIYKDCSDLALRTEAKDWGVSPGKYKLIKMLQTLDSDITVEDYKDAKVSEIIAKANEILQEEGLPEEESGESEAIAGKIKDAAGKVKEAKQNALQKQGQNDDEDNDSGENGTLVQEQNQNKEQVKNDNKNDNKNGVSGGENQNKNKEQDLTSLPENEQEQEENYTDDDNESVDEDDLSKTEKEQNGKDEKQPAGNAENAKGNDKSEKGGQSGTRDKD